MNKVLSPQEVHQLVAEGKCELIDVREAMEWAGGRVPGARHIPLGEIVERKGELSGDRQLILMCQGGARSAKAAQRLRDAGVENICELKGGYQNWEEAGLETEADSRAPWPLERQVRLAAGMLVLVGLTVSLAWPPGVYLSWFVGAGLVFAALTNTCGMGMLLARAPWNRVSAPEKKVACDAGG